MRIAFQSPSNIFCAWSFSDGIPATLKRMGHEVVDQVDAVRNRADFTLLSGPEHISEPINAGVRVAWWQETADRADHDFAPTYESMSPAFDLNYFIRKADAERFGGKWLPFAVDGTIFNTVGAPKWEDRQHKIAFVGQLYDSRRKFLDEYRKLGGPEIEILQFVGDGKSPEERARELADSHRNTQIFVVLPTLIRTTPCKVFEAAACGCCVVAPAIGDDYHSGETVRYLEDSTESFRGILGLCSNEGVFTDQLNRSTAWAAYLKTMAHHRLEQRLQQIVDDVKGLR